MLFDPFQEVDQNAWRDQNIISFFQTYTCQISAYRPTELTHRVKLVFLFRHKNNMPLQYNDYDFVVGRFLMFTTGPDTSKTGARHVAWGGFNF